MSDKDYAVFRDALAKEPASISIDDLASRVAKNARLDSEHISSLVRTLSLAYAAMDQLGESVDIFVGMLCDALREANAGKIKSVKDWNSKAKKRFQEIFSMHSSLGVSAKAIDVTRETERLWCKGRILTDLRPVFLSSSTKAQAAVVLHSLRVSYHLGPGPELGYFYVTLETDDLRNLQQIVERALAKDSDLRSRSSIPCLDYKVIED